jgi:ABC-2 type transport system permease protein
MISSLFKIEVEKLFRRGRSYISIIAVVVIVLVIEGGMMVDGEAIISFISENLQESFILQGNLLNGYLISFLSINSLWIHVPILIVIITGDLISGEANAGTLRLYLTRPVSRLNLVAAKFFAGMLYVVIMVVLLAVLSLGLGILFFGKGDIIVFFEKINVIPEKLLLGRFVLAFSYGIVSMWMVEALSFVFSAYARNSLTPIIFSMAIIILFTVISNFELGIFGSVKPFLFTTYMNNWQAFFEYEINWHKVILSLGVLIAHIVFLFSLSAFIFIKKDITS